MFGTWLRPSITTFDLICKLSEHLGNLMTQGYVVLSLPILLCVRNKVAVLQRETSTRKRKKPRNSIAAASGPHHPMQACLASIPEQHSCTALHAFSSVYHITTVCAYDMEYATVTLLVMLPWHLHGWHYFPDYLCCSVHIV